MKVTFVIPGRNRSGGVRMAVEFAGKLAARGYGARVAYRASENGAMASLKKALGRVVRSGRVRSRGTDWIEECTTETVAYTDLSTLAFDSGEVVVALGSWTVDEVRRLNAPVHKVRYCVGFSWHLPEMMASAWSGPMATIASSSMLVPQLESTVEGKVLGIVPAGIHPEEYFVEPGAESAARDGIGLIFTNNPKKDPETAARVVEAIGDRWPSLPLYIFGEGRRDPRLPKSSYTRLPPIEEARGLYNRSKIWLLTSRSEGFGIPIVEAMACGCAVVSTNHDTAPGLIRDGENGLLVPIGDVDAFIRAIADLLENDEKREALVREGRETAKNFTWDRATDELEAVLERIVSDAAEAPHAEGAPTP